ncbi:topoisomerase VIA [Cryptosporidium ubiquitum]|uniref:Topoisomerase VIA n=1 Tax=Cryptosporidium ubiquitum TaxID=857276 RepID=A0A1J4MJ66_9CRYT|nr:topoisomerase VIA [Cryptosporidium ubiquitum]OII74238.1 topoisomerase VIA [Cryptosporidium ubiquitum]
MNLIENIVLLNLGKPISFNPLNWIDSFQIDKYVIKPSKRKYDIINIAKNLLDVEELGASGATITDIFDPNDSKYIIKTNVKYLLVIEKASIFQYLMEREVYNRIPCLIITGKGFPDISTRKLVSDIIHKSGITALYLGDFDPHGINIYLTYVRGSNNFESQMAACPSIYYLGIQYEDTKLLPSDECEMLCQQCKLMNDNVYKCELEAFQSISSDYLVNIYLPGKILKRSWI